MHPMALAVRLAAAGAAVVALSAGRLAAQTLQVTASNVVTSVPAPAVADFQAASNAGSSKAAGAVTFDLLNCPTTGSKQCVISVSASTVPTNANGRLAWSVTNPGTTDKGISCTSASAGSVGTGEATMLSCNATGNSPLNVRGIVVSFSYPVSWVATAPGTYTTSGLKLSVVYK